VRLHVIPTEVGISASYDAAQTAAVAKGSRVKHGMTRENDCLRRKFLLSQKLGPALPRGDERKRKEK